MAKGYTVKKGCDDVKGESRKLIGFPKVLPLVKWDTDGAIVRLNVSDLCFCSLVVREHFKHKAR